ncbi:hypothetical protein ACF0H5_021668 [Mactra antiquata]
METVTIERVHRRIGSGNSSSCARIAKFSNYTGRESIIPNCRQAFTKDSHFSVREDFTERVQLHRRELGKKLVHARSQGHYASLRYDKLIIDNSVYKYDDMIEQITRIRSTRVRNRRATGSRDRDFRRETVSRDDDVSDVDQSGSEGRYESEAMGGME